MLRSWWRGCIGCVHVIGDHRSPSSPDPRVSGPPRMVTNNGGDVVGKRFGIPSIQGANGGQ